MTGSRKVCFTVFLLSVLVLCAGLALAKKDPELKQCKHQCKVQRQFDEEQKDKCAKRCEDYYKEKKQREKEREGEDEEEEWETGGSREEQNTDEPEKHMRQCQKQCDRQEGAQQRMLCRLRCQEKYRREKEGEGEHNKHRKESQGEEEQQQQEEEEENPYVFEERHFTGRVKTEHGKIFLLPKFTERSKLLRGLEKYRLGILVANPQSFLAPSHLDADCVFFVSWGRGTVTLIRENHRDSFNVERGDIVTIRAGTPFYVVNTDDNEKLYIVKFVRPVNIPGEYKAFHGTGGENPESFLKAFSWEILEAAYKTPRDRLERLLSKQDQGVITKATKEQIRALSQSEEGPSIWPFAGESRETFNLFKKRPSQSNNYGKLFEVDSNDCKPLEELDVMVSYANITKGGMSAPLYNSRATKVAVVVAGEGHIEIACPHVSGSSERQQGSKKSRQEKGSGSYQKIRSRVRTDTVYIVPAGHPFVTVASGNQNLEVVCFEINAEGNIRFPLAGRRNIFKVMQREAKELAFNTKGEEVDRIFGNQDQEFFFQGPKWQHKQEGRAYE